jgi:hypothetical protein
MDFCSKCILFSLLVVSKLKYTLQTASIFLENYPFVWRHEITRCLLRGGGGGTKFTSLWRWGSAEVRFPIKLISCLFAIPQAFRRLTHRYRLVAGLHVSPNYHQILSINQRTRCVTRDILRTLRNRFPTNSKLPLCLINHHTMKSCWGGGIAPQILNLSTGYIGGWWASRFGPFTPREMFSSWNL